MLSLFQIGNTDADDGSFLRSCAYHDAVARTKRKPDALVHIAYSDTALAPVAGERLTDLIRIKTAAVIGHFYPDRIRPFPGTYADETGAFHGSMPW